MSVGSVLKKLAWPLLALAALLAWLARGRASDPLQDESVKDKLKEALEKEIEGRKQQGEEEAHDKAQETLDGDLYEWVSTRTGNDGDDGGGPAAA